MVPLLNQQAADSSQYLPFSIRLSTIGDVRTHNNISKNLGTVFFFYSYLKSMMLKAA